MNTKENLDENQEEIYKNIFGKWLWQGKDKNKEIQIEVIIHKKSLTIQPGEWMSFKIEKPISAHAEWKDSIIIFPPTRYFARYADDNALLFGEMKP